MLTTVSYRYIFPWRQLKERVGLALWQDAHRQVRDRFQVAA